MQPNVDLTVTTGVIICDEELKAIRGGNQGQNWPDRDPDDDLLIPDVN